MYGFILFCIDLRKYQFPRVGVIVKLPKNSQFKSETVHEDWIYSLKKNPNRLEKKLC